MQRDAAQHRAAQVREPFVRGTRKVDRGQGGAFWWQEADAALFASLRQWTGPGVRLVELDRHVNDAAFAKAAARTLLEMMR